MLRELRSNIPLLEYRIHNLSTQFIEDIGLKGGTPDCDDENSDADRRVGLHPLRQ